MFGEEENSNSAQPTVATSTIATFGIPINLSANIQSFGNPANPSFGIPRNPNAHIPTDEYTI